MIKNLELILFNVYIFLPFKFFFTGDFEKFRINFTSRSEVLTEDFIKACNLQFAFENTLVFKCQPNLLYKEREVKITGIGI